MQNENVVFSIIKFKSKSIDIAQGNKTKVMDLSKYEFVGSVTGKCSIQKKTVIS